MLPGVYQAIKKDGCVYYRANITYCNKHISLGSFDAPKNAHQAYLEAGQLLSDPLVTIDNVSFSKYLLSHEKVVSLLNFRDNKIYIKNPIYMHRKYFDYYLTPVEIYKFDIDDLFYYSGHKLLKRGGHLYVNDYGMQVTILSRYGIRGYAAAGKDYLFANQDSYDMRYENLININPFHGVRCSSRNGAVSYDTHIHIKGDFHVGKYAALHEAAIAYNKAVDLAHRHGISKNFPTNFLTELSAKKYAEIYVQIELSKKYIKYLTNFK